MRTVKHWHLLDESADVPAGGAGRSAELVVVAGQLDHLEQLQPAVLGVGANAPDLPAAAVVLEEPPGDGNELRVAGGPAGEREHEQRVVGAEEGGGVALFDVFDIGSSAFVIGDGECPAELVDGRDAIEAEVAREATAAVETEQVVQHGPLNGATVHGRGGECPRLPEHAISNRPATGVAEMSKHARRSEGHPPPCRTVRSSPHGAAGLQIHSGPVLPTNHFFLSSSSSADFFFFFLPITTLTTRTFGKP